MDQVIPPVTRRCCNSTDNNQHEPSCARQPKPVDNFEVMAEMCRRGLKIYMAPLSNIAEMQKVKAGAQITIGVEEHIMWGLNDSKFCGGFLLADKEQFDALKKELESRS